MFGIHLDNKQYLQSVKENEYFKPWKNSVPPKRVSVRKQLPDDYVSSDEGKASKYEIPGKCIFLSKSNNENSLCLGHLLP